jgi:LPXTG-motif cell wall-anchored protein
MGADSPGLVQRQGNHNMNKRIRSMSVMVLASLAMLAMVSTSAFAQYPPGTAFSVSCTSAGQAGASVTCSIVGANPGDELSVTASYGSTEFYSEVLTANADGEVTFRFTVPREARGQEITVSVLNTTSGETVATEVVIAAPGRTGEPVPRGRGLPNTGQDTILLGAAGLVLLTGGLLAVRRRKVDVDA